ncbi:MAG: prenyltransferase, partial [Chitinophagaceae bacterium]
MKEYIKLIRPKDWAKNLFLLIPVFFAGEIFNNQTVINIIGGFFCFSLVASSIYIINDYRDIEDDRMHPEKRTRPLAAGTVSKSAAIAICA